MKLRFTKSVGTAGTLAVLSLVALGSAGCNSQNAKAQQITEKNFRGDPSKMPESARQQMLQAQSGAARSGQQAAAKSNAAPK